MELSQDGIALDLLTMRAATLAAFGKELHVKDA